MFFDCLEFAAWTDEGQWNSIPHKLRDNVSTNHIQGFYWLLVIHSCHSSSFCFPYLFIFVWIVLLVYCRHLPTDGIFNQKTLKYLHFDIVNESTGVWSHLRHFAGSIINRFSSNKIPMGLWIAVKRPKGYYRFQVMKKIELMKDFLGLKFLIRGFFG